MTWNASLTLVYLSAVAPPARSAPVRPPVSGPPPPLTRLPALPDLAGERQLLIWSSRSLAAALSLLRPPGSSGRHRTRTRTRRDRHVQKSEARLRERGTFLTSYSDRGRGFKLGVIEAGEFSQPAAKTVVRPRLHLHLKSEMLIDTDATVASSAVVGTGDSGQAGGRRQGMAGAKIPIPTSFRMMNK